VTIEALAARLEDALARERRAIVALDAVALPAIALEKRDLLEQIERALPSTEDARRWLEPIHAEARINALLSKDIVDGLASILGVANDGTYDRGARPIRGAGSFRKVA
jgi:hypothetical protein